MAKPVVIVETDPLCLSALGILVASLGYEPMPFSSGRAACAALSAMDTSPHAIITEHDLFQSCSAECLTDSLRARFGPIPIIVLTADTSTETRSALMELDCSVLFKPAKPDEITRLLAGAAESRV